MAGPTPSPGRRALLAALVRVAARSGIDALTYRSVAAEAGVSHGLVRYHFGSLDGAVHEAALWAAQDSIERSTLLAATSLEEFASGLSALVRDDPEKALFQHALVFRARSDPELGRAMRDIQARYVAAIEGMLQTLGFADTKLLARTVFTMLNGFVIHQLAYGDPRETDEHIAVLHALLAARLERDSRLRAA